MKVREKRQTLEGARYPLQGCFVEAREGLMYWTWRSVVGSKSLPWVFSLQFFLCCSESLTLLNVVLLKLGGADSLSVCSSERFSSEKN